MAITLHPLSRIQGTPNIPGDKSISHRALLFGALALGRTEISHLLESEDIHSTWRCLESLGVQITRKKGTVWVEGKGKDSLRTPSNELDCGNSGTTLRLLMGILAGQDFSSFLVGDLSLSGRPMKRVADPLRKMRAQIQLREKEFAPVVIQGSSRLQAISYELPVASAQLKSALILAALYAEGETFLSGKIESRDHTERLLPHFGVQLKKTDSHLSILGGQELRSAPVVIPADLSSAAFWISAAILVPNTVMELENISLNPSRIGFLNVLKRMGARIEMEVTASDPEPVGRLRITSGPLHATQIHPLEIPSLIDEIPLIAILASFAEGTTEVRGAEELRTKETDRILAVAQNLRAMGVLMETYPDGFSITGPQPLQGAKLHSWHDHRIAMAFSIAALRAKGPTVIHDHECVGISYPTFYESLKTLTRN